MGDGRRFLKNTKLKEGDGTGNRQKMPKVDSSRDGSVSTRFGGGESAIGRARRTDGKTDRCLWGWGWGWHRTRQGRCGFSFQTWEHNSGLELHALFLW